MRRFGFTAIAVVLAFAMTGCGGGSHTDKAAKAPQLSDKEWRAGVEKIIGHPFRSDAAWQSYAELYRGPKGWCKQNVDDLAMSMAVGLDSNQSIADQERQLKLACPNRSKMIDTAVKDVQGTASKADRICGSDPQLLNAKDRDFYDAVC